MYGGTENSGWSHEGRLVRMLMDGEADSVLVLDGANVEDLRKSIRILGVVGRLVGCM